MLVDVLTLYVENMLTLPAMDTECLLMFFCLKFNCSLPLYARVIAIIRGFINATHFNLLCNLEESDVPIAKNADVLAGMSPVTSCHSTADFFLDTSRS